MKRTALIHGILLIAALAATSCLRVNPAFPSGSPVLSVRPSIFRGESQAVTKAQDTDAVIHAGDEVEARDEYRENFFGSLDIFVKRHADAPGTAWFKEYHLNAGDPGVIIDQTRYDSESLLDQAKQALASNWAEQGYEPETPYDIYVTANNPHTSASAAPANLTALQALSTTSNDIYRYWLDYVPSQTDPNYWTNALWSEKKYFLMDGSIEGWTIDPSTPEQIFDVDLKRAAAKIIVNVSFSDENTMLKVAEATPQNPNPTPEQDSDGRDVYCTIQEYMQYVGRTAGEPRWKYVNFNMTGADIACAGDTIPSAGDLETGSGNFTPIKIGDSLDNTENSFTFTTYTYPVDWSSDQSRTPYILLSVFYTRASDGDQLRSYYRIPVCDESAVTSLDRNHIYIVDVKIGSLGASNESFDAMDEQLRIEYHVIPWTETNMSQEATTVKISDTKYLTIIPTEYLLKGDGVQSVDLQWYASVSTDDNRIVDIDPSSLQVSYVNYQGVTTDIKGTVTKQVRNNSGTLVTATDANTDGKRDIVITSTAPTSTAAGETLKITVTPGGLIIVESQALDSRAIKNISFTVYLKNASGVDPVTVNIRHFPLDNIQSIAGSWSSRWDKDKTAASPGTGQWVDYDRDNGHSYNTANVKYTEGNSFIAKVYNSSDSKIYAINVTRSGNSSNYQYAYSRATSQASRGYNTYSEESGYQSQRNSAMTSLTNNQMYVIQVTTTSNKYVLGRPVMGSDNLSQDKVVSPAFMIASQLGATVEYSNSTLASSHCTSYMEVGTDGTRYVGWRLPTEQEIDFIIEYQKNTSAAYNHTLAPVLTGYGYWALSGVQKNTTYTSGGSNRVRCVRDMTLEEINKLNRTGN
ncbi:MAG: hypothetical protein J5640_01950 [Bacteroidales bacterium]|nr:hypothetical protein [Bacteroidales bacterium]